jgi:diguanylate cyclase (GGDEF)-like protein/PAS domain S-box-containing protein
LRRALHAQATLIHQQLAHEASLETRYRTLFERNLAAVFSWRPSGEITDCNPAFSRMLGFDAPEQVVGLSYWSLLADQSQRPAFDKNIGNLSGFETSLRRADGDVIHLLENITAVGSGESISYETTALDVTQSRRDRLELQQAHDAARREAERDALTGLPNRRYFTQFVRDQLSMAALGNRTVGMLFIDLDRFKTVNDTFGHLTGDLLLQEVASRLDSCLLHGDSLCRLGGDEFAVLLTRTESIRDSLALACRLLDTLRRPFKTPQRDLTIGAGIGISFFPNPAPDFSSLLQQADAAMYLAKSAGRNRIVQYSTEIGAAIQEKNRITAELSNAIARGEIAVHYQPQFSGSTHHLIRFEALARWTSPVLGAVAPSRFIPVAEENGMILELGAQVLATACRDAALWQRKTGCPIPVAVNISSLQLRSESFVDDVLRTLTQAGLAPDLLELEMTESIMLDDLQRCREMLIRLRASGIRLALDDFGTGYSSLAYLQDLPFDRIKISPAFLAKAHRGRGGEALIQAIISVAHTLNLSVVVEGIANSKDLELVRALGADELQGFLLGHPTPDPCSVIASHKGRRADAEKSAAWVRHIFADPVSSHSHGG